MFNRRSKTPTVEETLEETRHERWERRRAELAALARAEEPAVLARAHERAAAFAVAYERDLAAYKFECRRWGDFLALFIERANPNHERGEPAAVLTCATAVNLRDTRELRLDEGHGPDDEGVVCYYWNTVGGSDRLCVAAWPPAGSYPRLFALDDPDRGYLSYGPDNMVDYKTSNYPRPAGDDRIRFEGIGGTLYAPAGRGAEVRDVILREIERGSAAG